jgi:hypothetical protein
MKTWDNILISVISNKMDPESKKLLARRIASAEELTNEMLLEKRQLESENASHRVSKTHIQPQQQQQQQESRQQPKRHKFFHATMIST